MSIDERLGHAGGTRSMYDKQRLRLIFGPRLVECKVVVLDIEEIRDARNFNDMKVEMITNSGNSWRSGVR